MDLGLLDHGYLLLLMLHRCYGGGSDIAVLLLSSIFETLGSDHDYLVLLTLTVTVDSLLRFCLRLVAEAARGRLAVLDCLSLFGIMARR